MSLNGVESPRSYEEMLEQEEFTPVENLLNLDEMEEVDRRNAVFSREATRARAAFLERFFDHEGDDIACLVAFLKLLREEPSIDLEVPLLKKPRRQARFGELAGMTVAATIIQGIEDFNLGFKRIKAVEWLGEQLVNLVPQVGSYRSAFTEEDVQLLVRGLSVYMAFSDKVNSFPKIKREEVVYALRQE